MTADPRLESLYTWLDGVIPHENGELTPASSDASFRRYFRWNNGKHSYVCMDAPPDKENIIPFIAISKRMEQAGVNVPHIHAQNINDGFLLLDDLGTEDYLSQLDDDSVDGLYSDALTALLHINQTDCSGLPLYDEERLLNEMNLFKEWFLVRHCGIILTDDQEDIVNKTFGALIDNAYLQPQVFVHRDYHSRNLMYVTKNNPGVIDFQDAVKGPITYDLVSLLKDCYIKWPKEFIRAWALNFRDMAVNQGQLETCDNERFLRWFDLMGMQRHLKVLGIFARLNYRDNKSGYLKDLPLTYQYLIEAADDYDEFSEFSTLLRELNIRDKLKA